VAQAVNPTSLLDKDMSGVVQITPSEPGGILQQYPPFRVKVDPDQKIISESILWTYKSHWELKIYFRLFTSFY